MLNSLTVRNSLVLLFSVLAYGYFGYFLERSSFNELIFLILLLFCGSYYFIEKSKLEFKYLVLIALVFRVLFLRSIPNLSQDFYRFLWDGRMLSNGYNPYLTTPISFIESNLFPVSQARTLFEGMGSLNAGHYTNYPPLSQLSYWLTAIFGGDSILSGVIVLRLILILSDIGIAYFGVKTLALLNLPKKNIFYYLLNPFVIIEIIGNLHFEALMGCFLIISIYFLLKEKWLISAFLLGLSISVKLITLLFLPLFIYYFLKSKLSLSHLNWKGFFKYIGFCFAVLITTLVTFIPFLSQELIANFSKSVGLWFGNFEFNASVYYIIRAIMIKVIGWNLPGEVSKYLSLLTVLVIGILSLLRFNFKPQVLLSSMLFGIFTYLLCTSTVHPWYLTIPLCVSVFTYYKFIWVWTATIFLSYSAYGEAYGEKWHLITLEYAIVVLVFLYEVVGRNMFCYNSKNSLS